MVFIFICCFSYCCRVGTVCCCFNFFGKAVPDVAMNQLVCHIFLLTLSMVNVIYLFFIEGLGKRARFKNFLQQLAFFGALMQMGSCANSITRYNMQDVYNPSFLMRVLSLAWLVDASRLHQSCSTAVKTARRSGQSFRPSSLVSPFSY